MIGRHNRLSLIGQKVSAHRIRRVADGFPVGVCQFTVTFTEDRFGGVTLPVERVGRKVGAIQPFFSEAFGVEPINKGEGGSIPFIPELQRIFPNAQVLVTGPEDPKANAHSPNESISLPGLKNNVITEALLLDKLGK